MYIHTKSLHTHPLTGQGVVNQHHIIIWRHPLCITCTLLRVLLYQHTQSHSHTPMHTAYTHVHKYMHVHVHVRK